MPVFVALDCEMVGSGNQNLLARVSIVDQECKTVLLDEYVRPSGPVTHWRFFRDEDREKVLNGHPFSDVKRRVSNLISGKILVGHSLHSDLDALDIPHPEGNRRDLAKYGPFMKDGKPQSLKDLAWKHLKTTIQEGKHDSVEDACAAMKLYNLVANKWY